MRLELLTDATAPSAMDAADAPLRAVVDDVYEIALRMLWHPKDASDATERAVRAILVDLPTFRGENDRRPAALRIAIRSLLAAAPSPMERQTWSFEAIARDLARGLDEPLPVSVLVTSRRVLLEEVRIGCTQTMLLSLERDDRIAYVIGDLLGMTSELGSDILSIDQLTFAKRLLRARDRLRGFTREHCGLVNAACACRCSRRIGRALLTGRVNQGNLLFVSLGSGDGVPRDGDRDVDGGGPTADPARRLFNQQRLGHAPDVLLSRLTGTVPGKRHSSQQHT